jgi:hypothetical protein
MVLKDRSIKTRGRERDFINKDGPIEHGLKQETATDEE